MEPKKTKKDGRKLEDDEESDWEDMQEEPPTDPLSTDLVQFPLDGQVAVDVVVLLLAELLYFLKGNAPKRSFGCHVISSPATLAPDFLAYLGSSPRNYRFVSLRHLNEKLEYRSSQGTQS